MSSATQPAAVAVSTTSAAGPSSGASQGKTVTRRPGRGRAGVRRTMSSVSSAGKQNASTGKERGQGNAAHSNMRNANNVNSANDKERTTIAKNDRNQDRQEKHERARADKSEKTDNAVHNLISRKERMKNTKSDARASANDQSTKPTASSHVRSNIDAHVKFVGSGATGAGNNVDSNGIHPSSSPIRMSSFPLASNGLSTLTAGQLASPFLSSPDAIVTGNVAADNAPAAENENVLKGSLDDYRQGCLRLEKARHARLYDAERRVLYYWRAIRNAYDYDVRLAEEEFDQQRRFIAVQMLRENSEKMRRVEELRYKIVRDEVNGMYSRRHEMSLRGRSASSNHNQDHTEVDLSGSAILNSGISLGGYGNLAGGFTLPLSENGEIEEPKEKPTRRGAKKKDDASKHAPILRRTSVNIVLEEDDIQDDLAKMTGEKRTRHDSAAPSDAPTRKSKKRK